MQIPSRPQLPKPLCLSAILILLTTSVAMAQHDPGAATGGGMIGGSTERAKPIVKKPAITPRRKITPATVKRPTPTTTAATYYQQGEALYSTKNYREALDPYEKAIEINPSMASA